MKKILALVLSVLMVVTACAGLVTVSAAEDTTPVKIYDGDALTATGRAYCVSGTYSYASQLVRYNWFPQGGPIDPQFTLHDSAWGTLTVAPYMVIKYKTTTAGLQGGAFIGNGTIGQSFMTWNYSQADGNWAKAIMYLPDMIEGYYDESNNQITHFRWEVVENAADYPDGTLDVEYVAFFETYEDAEAFQHTNLPVDPDTAVSGSYKTYDFTTMTSLDGVLGGHYDVTTELVDGALRLTALGADPYVKLLTNGSEELGLSGKQAHYILVKYKTSTAVENPQMKFFSNVPGVAGWGGAGSYTNVNNQDVLTADGNWHYIMIDASQAWGSYDSMLNAFRIDALDTANAGDTIDIASIKFFTTSDWVGSYIKTIADTDEAAKEIGITYGWVEEEPEVTVMLGDVTGDGNINAKDLNRLKKYLASAGDGSVELTPEAAGDVTGDGNINAKDLNRLKKYLASAGDGSVELG